MTVIVISILRIGGLAFGVLGAIVTLIMLPGTIQIMNIPGPQSTVAGFTALFSGLYPIITGAALYGFAEVISLLVQIRDHARD